MRWNFRFITLIIASILIMTGCQSSTSGDSIKQQEGEPSSNESNVGSNEKDWQNYNPPSLEDVPEGPEGEAILFGYNLVNSKYSWHV